MWSKKQKDHAGVREAELTERCRRHKSVLMVTGDRAGHELPKVDIDVSQLHYHVAESAAQGFARRLGSCSNLASSFADILERDFNVQVWFIDMGDEGASAACSVGDYGAAVFVNSSDPPW